MVLITYKFFLTESTKNKFIDFVYAFIICFITSVWLYCYVYVFYNIHGHAIYSTHCNVHNILYIDY